MIARERREIQGQARRLISHFPGIGEGFVKKYLSRPNTTIIGTVRSPDGEEGQALTKLPAASGSKVILVKVESTSDTDAKNAISTLSSHNISHIDTVIANAGIFRSDAFHKISEMKTSDLLKHVDVNAAGVVRLFQATLPLLRKADKPIFMAVSSVVASLGGMEHSPYTLGTYGASKAALNFLVRCIHFEQPELIAFAVHPG